jgi:hypothetical protein
MESLPYPLHRPGSRPWRSSARPDIGCAIHHATARSRRPWPPSRRGQLTATPITSPFGWPAPPVWPPTSSAGWRLPCTWAAWRRHRTSMGSHRATGHSTDAVTTPPVRSSSRHPSSRADRPGRDRRRTARGGRTVRPTSPAVAVTAPAPPATAATGSSSNCRFDDTITFECRSSLTSAIARSAQRLS